MSGKPAKGKPPTLHEMVADAMNEQGFLLAQAVQAHVQHRSPMMVGGLPPWEYTQREYPVTASDGSQTRIDLEFRSAREKGVYACIECKRAHPAYKRWVFFNQDRTNTCGTLWFEIVQ